MSMPVITNKVDIKINRDNLFYDYDIIRVSNSDNYIGYDSPLLDEVKKDKNVCSVLYRGGNDMYILYKGNARNFKLEDDDISVNCDYDLPDDYIAQLLLNSLNSNGICNLTGHCYCFNPEWVSIRKDEIYKIVGLEINIKETLTINVKTFTKTTKEKSKGLAMYEVGSNYTLKRTNAKEGFVIRHPGNKKSFVPFFSFRDEDYYDNSKLGVLNKILEQLEKKYGYIIKLNFETIDEYIALDHKKAVALPSFDNVVISGVNEDYKNRLKEIIEHDYGIVARLEDKPNKDALNFVVLPHNKEYYKDNENETDPYENIPGYVIQHLTLEDCDIYKTKGYIPVLRTLICNLLMKRDIKEKRISFINWSDYGFEHDVKFAKLIETKTENSSDKKLVIMNIHPNGTFDIETITVDCSIMFNQKYAKYADIIYLKNTKGFVIDHNDNINIIYDTDLMTLPMFQKIGTELKESENGKICIRSKDKREELLYSCLDIKFYEKDDKYYYFAGMIGNGMNSTIPRASKIRSVELHRDSSIIFEDMLQMMDVTFVRNNQLTVMPFPFKYIDLSLDGISV